jgi:hypothetical protein
MTKHNSLAPEALPKRPDLDHNRFEAGVQPMDISGIRVDFGSKTKPHMYNAPTGEGVVSRRLRRFALTLTRFQIPKASSFAKRWKLPSEAVQSATNVIAIRAHSLAFNDDPTSDTFDTKVLISLLNETNPSSASFLRAYSFIGSGAYQSIIDGITDKGMAFTMMNVSDTVTRRYLDGWRWSDISNINSRHNSWRAKARRTYRDLAKTLLDNAEHNAMTFATDDEAKKRDKASDQFGKGKAQVAEGNGWYPLYVSKPDLPLNHTGKLGRRTVYTDSGASPKNISRYYTDPERRIFTRKTRSLGAVVVMDCSGSMSLSEQDLQQLMSNTAGATVLCYSTGNRADEENPNAWIVARKNRQVRRLPNFPGGNGCDAPALRYALTLRDTSKQPIVWVTDYGVTGMYDHQSDALVSECQALVKRNGIIVEPTIKSAIRKLQQLQGKA